jgi:hypothetical protein
MPQHSCPIKTARAVTDYEAGRQGFDSRKGRNFSQPHRYQTGSEATTTSPLFSGYRDLFFIGVKRLERDVDPPPSSAIS